MALLKMRPGDMREWKKGDPTASALWTDKRQAALRSKVGSKQVGGFARWRKCNIFLEISKRPNFGHDFSKIPTFRV